jgi:predicted acyl esterase
MLWVMLLQAAVVCAAAPLPAGFEQRRVAMQDGTELAICLAWPPGERKGKRFPVLLTTDPYTQRCGTFGRAWYADYVRAGYVVAYAQVRGTGESSGRLPEREYSDQEIDDAVEMIDWLARQPWSTGKVGMFGTSWSGFNALLVAARNPPALKAIVPHMATEDLYHEDARYPGGIFHLDDWNVFADLFLVVTPERVDPFDETLLGERFDQPPWSLVYLKQQRDGPFWRNPLRRNVAPRVSHVPTLMIGAWHDPYRDAALRALEHSSGPVRALIGPWNHSGDFPAPAADLGRVALQWWDHFLKGEENGVLAGPQLHAYMRRPHSPRITQAAIPGEWRAIDRWKEAPVTAERWHLNAGRDLERRPGAATQERLRMVPSTGVSAGTGWIDIPPDQRSGDAQALVYESAPLTEELQILGKPVARLITAVDAQQANWIVKLSDVAPDGSTTLVTGGAMNGTHRSSSVTPRALERGVLNTLELPMLFTSWIFPPGHRIRISVANALWPAFWPSPGPVEMTLRLGEGGSWLSLPVIAPQTPEAAAAAAEQVGSRNLGEAEAEAMTGGTQYTWNGPKRSGFSHDEIARRTTYVRAFQWEVPEGEDVVVEYTVDDDDPANASFKGTAFYRQQWNGQPVEWRGSTELRSDATTFHFRHVREVLRNGEVVRRREWNERVARDFQ